MSYQRESLAGLSAEEAGALDLQDGCFDVLYQLVRLADETSDPVARRRARAAAASLRQLSTLVDRWRSELFGRRRRRSAA